MEIIKTFNGTTAGDMKEGGITILWEELLPAIKQAVRLREDEIVDGFIITDEKISVKISRKKGRKTKS